MLSLKLVRNLKRIRSVKLEFVNMQGILILFSTKIVEVWACAVSPVLAGTAFLWKGRCGIGWFKFPKYVCVIMRHICGLVWMYAFSDNIAEYWGANQISHDCIFIYIRLCVLPYNVKCFLPAPHLLWLMERNSQS